MPRHLSVGSVIDKNKITSNAVWVALLKVEMVDPNLRDVVETLYIARNNENVTFGGQTYIASNFDLRVDQKSNEAPAVSLTVNDQMRYIQQRLDEMAGGIFSNIELMVVNLERVEEEPEFSERFQVISASVKDYVISIQLGAENPLGIQFPKHKQWKDRCAWRFKGYGCSYSGPMASCDYTKDGPNGCKAHDNLARFRGLPGLVRMNL